VAYLFGLPLETVEEFSFRLTAELLDTYCYARDVLEGQGGKEAAMIYRARLMNLRR